MRLASIIDLEFKNRMQTWKICIVGNAGRGSMIGNKDEVAEMDRREHIS